MLPEIILWRREDKGTVLHPQAADRILCPAHPIQEQERRTAVLTGEGWSLEFASAWTPGAGVVSLLHFPSRVPLNGPWLAVMDTGLPGHLASIRTTSASPQQTGTPPGRNEVGHSSRDHSIV